jgi:hypothetical protein
MNDMESQTPITLPPSLIRNRCVFAIFDISLLLLNSFWAHRQVAVAIISLPVIDVLKLPSKFRNDTQSFSKELLEEINRKNAAIRWNINETLEQKTIHINNMAQKSTEKLQARKDEEKFIKNSYFQKVTFLQAWSRMGNTIPYLSNSTRDQQLVLETLLNLENGAMVDDIVNQSTDLSNQFSARYEYDSEYLRNKTSGLLPNLIQKLSVSFQLPSLRMDIHSRIMQSYMEVLEELKPVRNYIAHGYDSISKQLHLTELAIETIAIPYDELLNAIRHFYEILDGVHVFGFDPNVFPRLDLRDFPPSVYFFPDSIQFPSTPDFMYPFDEVILQLQLPFEHLAVDISNLVDITVDAKVNGIILELMDALSLDDYFPPSISLQGVSLSIPDALQISRELTDSLTIQANRFPSPPKISEPPPFEFPQVVYEPQNMDFARPVTDLFTWTMPATNSMLLILRDIIVFIWNYYLMVQVFCINIYRAMRRALEYYEGTAVPLPVVDLRTKAEQVDAARNSRNRLKILVSYVFHPMVGSFFTQLIPFIILAAIISAWSIYYFKEFHPNCVLTSTGTNIGNMAVGPMLYNRALAAGQRHAGDLTVQNQAYIYEECQKRSVIVFDVYRQQVITYEESRTNAMFYLSVLDRISSMVDLDNLCVEYTLACSGLNFTRKCPILEYPSILLNPCDFVNVKVETMQDVLDSIDFRCDDVSPGDLSLTGARKRVKEQLQVAENWCIVEWWFLGYLWRCSHIVAGYFLFSSAFYCIIEGLRLLLWNSFRPTWWTIECTADQDGVFTQPEYSDTEAKKNAIREWKFGHYFEAIVRLVFGISLCTGWVVQCFVTWRFNMVPSWYIIEPNVAQTS